MGIMDVVASVGSNEQASECRMQETVLYGSIDADACGTHATQGFAKLLMSSHHINRPGTQSQSSRLADSQVDQ